MDQDIGLSIGDRYSIIAMIFYIPYVSYPCISQSSCDAEQSRSQPNFPAPLLSQSWRSRLDVGTRHCVGCCHHRYGLHHELDPGPRSPHPCGCLRRCLLPRLYLSTFLLVSIAAAVTLALTLTSYDRYVRYEVQMRFAVFYLFGTLAGGLANLFAYGLSRMDGVGGIGGWRWIFIIEGIVTMCLGVVGFLIIVDFPDKATKLNPFTRRAFLTEHEAAIVVNRINRDRGDAVVDELTWAKTLECLKDWKIWEFAWLFFISVMMTNTYSLFMPLILRVDMGYSVTMSMLLSFPPYVTSIIWYLTTAWTADRLRKRGQVIMFNSLLSVAGLCMTAFTARDKTAVRYAGIFIGMSSNTAVSHTIFSYMHNNIVGQKKRSIASTVLVTGSAIGGLAAANIFRQADAPRYT